MYLWRGMLPVRSKFKLSQNYLPWLCWYNKLPQTTQLNCTKMHCLTGSGSKNSEHSVAQLVLCLQSHKTKIKVSTGPGCLVEALRMNPQPRLLAEFKLYVIVELKSLLLSLTASGGSFSPGGSLHILASDPFLHLQARTIRSSSSHP